MHICEPLENYMRKRKKALWRFVELVNIFILIKNIITTYVVHKY